jgi:hypothetical protein
LQRRPGQHAGRVEMMQEQIAHVGAARQRQIEAHGYFGFVM